MKLVLGMEDLREDAKEKIFEDIDFADLTESAQAEVIAVGEALFTYTGLSPFRKVIKSPSNETLVRRLWLIWFMSYADVHESLQYVAPDREAAKAWLLEKMKSNYSFGRLIDTPTTLAYYTTKRAYADCYFATEAESGKAYEQ